MMTGAWRNRKEQAIRAFFFLAGVSVILILGGIFVMLLTKGVKTFDEVSIGEFFFTTRWDPTSFVKPAYGIVGMALSTLLVTAGAMLIAVPLGIGTAAYLSDIAPYRVRDWLKPIIEMLAGIPSVAIGFIGIVLIGPVLARMFGTSSGLNALNGSILLAIMALPTIVSITEDALRAVPKSYKEASYALGANRWTTLVRVTIPAATPAIVAAIMLGIGRAIGETMTVLMATGNALAMPSSIFDSVRTMTATIAIELGEVPYDTTHYYALFAVGAVLFVMSFVVNLIAELVTAKQRKYRL